MTVRPTDFHLDNKAALVDAVLGEVKRETCPRDGCAERMLEVINRPMVPVPPNMRNFDGRDAAIMNVLGVNDMPDKEGMSSRIYAGLAVITWN